MTDYEKEVVSNLKFDLSRLEEDIERTQNEMDRLLAKKKAILDELAKHTDQKYEEDMLAMVYDQRRKR